MTKLIISDTHLGKFNKKQFNFLYNLIESVDEVIINGDFWDSWCISFEKFINSQWQNLFDLLLEKNTIYIYGNHDPKELCDERCSLFAVETVDSYQFELCGQKFHCEHGHHLTTSFFATKLFGFYYKLIGHRPSGLQYLIAKTEKLLFYLFPKLIHRTTLGQHTNRILRKNLKADCINIFGHSHNPDLDIQNNFINTGATMCEWASYVLIEDKNIRLEKSRY